MPEWRTKYWCFTINNPPESAYEDLSKLYPETASYLVFQLEAGERGTRHIQGYICLKTRVRMPGIRRLIPGGHYEKARGSAEQNKEYCTKEPRLQDFVELGTMPVDGGKEQNSELREATERIVAGSSIQAVARELPTAFVRNFRGLRNLQSMLFPPEERPNRVVLWLYGPSGCGKSRLAYALSGITSYWHPMQNWWDEYEGQETVVFDDFRSDSFGNHTFVSLLRYIDRYPIRVPVKGAYAPLRATRFIITTLYDPQGTYPGMHPDELYQLQRRITQEVNVGAGETYVWPLEN